MQYEKTVFSQLNNGDEQLNVFFDEKAPVLYQHAEKIEEGSKKPSVEYIEEWMKAEAREIEVYIFMR